MNDYEPFESDVRPSRKHGCLFYGCISLIVLTVIVAIAVGLAVRYVTNTIYSYTSDHPAPVPHLEMPAGEIQAVEDRFRAFIDAVKAGKPVDPLVLTADDVNALISRN